MREDRQDVSSSGYTPDEAMHLRLFTIHLRGIPIGIHCDEAIIA